MNWKKAAVLTGGGCALALCAYVRPLRPLENILYDLTFSRASAIVQDSVAIVGIDPESIGKIGAWPWPRSIIAACIEKINAARPSALAIDMLFPRRTDDSAGSAALARALCATRALVLPFRAQAFTAGRGGATLGMVPAFVNNQRLLMVSKSDTSTGINFFRATNFNASDSMFTVCASRGGVINVTTSSSTQTLRQVVQAVSDGGEYYPSFSLSAAAAFLQCKAEDVALDATGFVRIGGRRVPLSSHGATTPVHFRGRRGAITTLSAAQVMSDPAIAATLCGKLVFFGVTDPATGVDFFTTPVGVQFPGVELWATAALDILQRSWIIEEHPLYNACSLLWLLFMFPGLLLIPGLKKERVLIAACLLAAASIGAEVALMRWSLYFWTPVYHVLALAACVFVLAARKNITFLADGASMDFTLPPDQSSLTLPAPSDESHLKTIPQAQSAIFVAQSLGIAMSPAKPEASDSGASVEGAPQGQKPGSGDGYALSHEDAVRLEDLCGGKIVKLLGSGGMADVFLVWNKRLEVYRAVKVIQPGMPETFRQRFETEIRILSKLTHPHIVQMYSVGDWRGLPYIEMEYVQGASMDAVCNRLTLLSPLEVMAVGIATCRGLHYAHTQPTTIYGASYKGVIHRDLKPANIMISVNGVVKLADFGIARPETVSLHTMDAGKIVGTLPYLAPEQFDGAEPTLRVDLYALGATLYELVSGERAFPQTEMSSLVKAKALGTVKPLPGHVPKECVAIITKAMAIKPEQRYDSAGAMARDLERALRLVSGAQGYAILQGLAKRFNG